MKTFKVYFLSSVLGVSFLIAGFQIAELGIVSPDLRVSQSSTMTIPPWKLSQQNLANITRWRIEWSEINWSLKDHYARFFSIEDGSFHSINSLNNDWRATAKADIDLLFGRVQNVQAHPSLVHGSRASATVFKRSTLTAESLKNITENQPASLRKAYEQTTNAACASQPYRSSGGAPNLYESGDIYLFKTEQSPPQYGAIRIVNAFAPTIIEVLVQHEPADTHSTGGPAQKM